MLCLVDYLGFRVVAMTKVPLKPGPPAYGSNDGGATVFATVPELNNLMKAAATQLNLREHLAG